MYGNPLPNHQIYKSTNIFAMAVWGPTAKFNSRQYFQLYGTNIADPGSTSMTTFQLMYAFLQISSILISRSYFTSSTPDKDQKIGNSSTLFLFRSYNLKTLKSCVLIAFVHAIRTCWKSALCKMWHILVPLNGFP